jgi:hypothetical protein
MKMFLVVDCKGYSEVVSWLNGGCLGNDFRSGFLLKGKSVFKGIGLCECARECRDDEEAEKRANGTHLLIDR